MRSHPSCWNMTLTKLGFRRKRRKGWKKATGFQRQTLFENLEQRQMLTGNSVVVDTETNVISNDGLTSLQEAFDLVASDPLLDTIEFAPELAGKTIAFPATEGISNAVNLIGPTDDPENRLTLDAASSNRFFYIGATGDLSVTDLVLIGGKTEVGSGGSITNFGNLALNNVDIVGSEANTGNGGAISSLSSSTLHIEDSLFLENSAKNGGAISYSSSAPDGLSITGTTFYKNAATGSTAAGGAIHLGGSNTDVTITNSTFSENTSERWGGAIQVNGSGNTLDLVNSTITQNSSTGTVGGLRNSSTGTVTMHNTVIAENDASWAYTVDGEGSLSGTSAQPSTNNFLGVTHSGLEISDGVNFNRTGTIASPNDPMLLPIAASFSGQLSHAPVEGSPLIDSGSTALAAAYGLDQDGRAIASTHVDRVYNYIVDIGAHEYKSQPIGLSESFVVNDDHVNGDQSHAWVATNGAGQSVVVWLGAGPEGDGLYAQLVNDWDPAATVSNATSVPRLVNYGTPGNLDGGGNESATALISVAQVAVDGEGNYAVVWGESDSTADSSETIYLRRYRKDGTPIDSLPIEVSKGTVESSYPEPSVVGNDAGQLLVTWRDGHDALRFRRYSTSGLTLDYAAQTAASYDDGEWVMPSSRRHAAIAGDGSFYIQWGQFDATNNLQLYLQAYSAEGSRVGELQAYATHLSTNLYAPDFPDLVTANSNPWSTQASVFPFDVVATDDGSAIVVWTENSSWNGVNDGLTSYSWNEKRLFYRRFSPAEGWREPTEVTSGRSVQRSEVIGEDLTQAFIYDSILARSPGIAVDGYGRVGVAWGQSTSYTLDDLAWAAGSPIEDLEEDPGTYRTFVRWFDGDDHPLTDNAIEATAQFFVDSEEDLQPSLAADDLGGFVLTGYVEGNIQGQRYQLPVPYELDSGGVLWIRDYDSTLVDIVVRTELHNGQRLVVVNDILTGIPTHEVEGIKLHAGASSNFIDLTRVTQVAFPNLDGLDIRVNAGDGNDEIHASDLGGNYWGEAGDDRIFGSLGDDVLVGGLGNDTLSGGFGADILLGREDNDVLYGGLGDDLLYGERGNDRLLGDEGNDQLEGGAGDDQLDGGTGQSDTLHGGDDNDLFVLTDASAPSVTIVDTSGIDRIDLSGSASKADLNLAVSTSDLDQTVFQPVGFDNRVLTLGANTALENATGTEFDDTIDGNQYDNELLGGAGRDTIRGWGGDDLISGDSGGDLELDGGSGPNDVRGGTGNDNIYAREGFNILDGGFGDDVYFIQYSDTLDHEFEISDLHGVDTLSFAEWSEPAWVDLSNFANDATQSLRGPEATNIRLVNQGLIQIENLVGGDGDDIFIGHGGENELVGGGGVDVLEGAGGYDIIIPNANETHVKIADSDVGEPNTTVALTGSDWVAAPGGYYRSQSTNEGGATGQFADWSFSGLEEGAEYEVYVSWYADEHDPETITDSASYTVQLGTQAPLATDTLNQQQTPGDRAYGAAWHRLTIGDVDLFTADATGELTVRLDLENSAFGTVFADAVRIVKHNHAPTIDVKVFSGDASSATPLVDNTWDWHSDSTRKLLVTASDVDADDILELVLDKGTNDSVDPGNLGDFTITPRGEGFSHQWIVEYLSAGSAIGTLPVSFRVRDSAPDIKSDVATIYLNNGPSSIAPTIGGLPADLSFEVDEVEQTLTFSFYIDGTDSGVSGFEFSFGPGAPASLSVDAIVADPSADGPGGQPGYQFSWTPQEQDDGQYTFDLRVTDQGAPALRTSETLTFTVSEINAAPEVDFLDLFYYPGAADGATPTVAYADLYGTVFDDESVDFLEIEIDYGYDGTPSNFKVDEIVSARPLDSDSTKGTFEITPGHTWFTDDQPITIGVRAAEIFSASGDIEKQANPTVITLTPDFDLDDPPTLAVSLLYATGTASDSETISTVPLFEGHVQNSIGPTEGLNIRVYQSSTDDFSTASLVPGDVETDAAGGFTFTPSSLPAPGAGQEDSTTYFWFQAEEPNPFERRFAEPAVSERVQEVVNYAPLTAPTIASLSLKNNTGDPDNDSPQVVTSDPTLVGQLEHEFGVVGDVAVEFYSDSGFTDTSFLGTAITDDTGAFEFIPPGINAGLPITIYARAFVWDDYLNQDFYGTQVDGIDQTTFVYDPDEHEVASVDALYLTHEAIDDDLAGNVADVYVPSISGSISNDGELYGVMVEFVVTDDLIATPDFSSITGAIATDESGEFQFTPANLQSGTDYAVYARAVELGADTAGPIYQLTSKYNASLNVNFRLGDAADMPLSIATLQLAYDTGLLGDFITANPTVTGTIDYAGDYADVQVEFDLDGDLDTIEGYASPDQATGVFEFTPVNLPEGEFIVQAWLRVPNFGTQLPQFENDVLANVDGQLDVSWFETGYDEVGGWVDTDNDGVPDVNSDWINSVFAGDGLTLNGDETTAAGQWLASDFDRDWNELLADLTSEPQTFDGFDSTNPPTLNTSDLAHNNDPYVVDVDWVGSANNPTLEGRLVDDGPVGDVMLEFYLGGREILDGAVWTEKDGTFSYTFEKHTTGVQEFEILVHEPVYESDPNVDVTPREYWFSDTNTLTLNIPEQTDLKVTKIGLRDPVELDSDLATFEAIDSTLVGLVNVPGRLQHQTVEFDLNADGFADAYAITLGDGSFEFVPIGVETIDNSDGTFAATIYARVASTEVDFEFEENEIEYSVYGPWTQFDWTIYENVAPEITQYELAYDTGNTGLGYEVLDRVTSDPTLVGRVFNANGAEYLQVEFDHNGDGFVDGTTTTDQDGYFRYQPSGLSLGRWDIRARVTEVDTVTGESLGADDWQAIEGVAGEDSFDGFTLVAPNALPVLGDLLEVSASSLDPTITGQLVGVDVGENLVVEFFIDGSTEAFGSTAVQADGSFEFTPAGLDFGTNYEFTAKVKRFNYLTGAYDESNLSNPETVSFSLEGEFGVSNFGTEVTASLLDVTLTGAVVPPDGVAAQHVEIIRLDAQNHIIPATVEIAPIEAIIIEGNAGPASDIVRQGFSFQPELDPAGETVKFRARAVGFNADGYVFGSWSPQLTVTYDPQLPTLTVGQETATGGAAIATSSTLVGQVSLASGQTGASEVDLDFDGDGVVDDTVLTEDGTYGTAGSFTYELPNASAGEVTVWVRPAWYHTFTDDDFEQTERIEGAWEKVAFTLESAAPSIENLTVADLVDTIDGTLQTYEPSIVGDVTTALPDTDVAGMTVEIDSNGDGVADGSTVVYSDGTFEYTVEGLYSESLSSQQQTVSLQVRGVDAYSDEGILYGEWQPFEFVLLRTEAPDILSMALETDEDSDPTTATSSSPVIVGTVGVFPSDAIQVTVEFDHDEDETIDGTTTVDLLGNFEYVPLELPYGPSKIDARVVLRIGSETLHGDWFDLDGNEANGRGIDFHHKSAEPAVINELQLLDADTATLAGRASVGGFGQRMFVEVRVVGSVEPGHKSFTVDTDRNGHFEFSVPYLSAYDSYNIEVRGLTADPNADGYVAGAWRELEGAFIYNPDPILPATLTSFDIAFDTGEDQMNRRTNDPTLRGTVNQWQPQLHVEIRSDDEDEIVAVPVLPDGTFEYTPDLTYGIEYVMLARTRLWDPFTTEYVYDTQNWSLAESSTFTLDASENSAVTINELNVAQNTAQIGQLQQTNSPTFKGQVSNDGNVAGLIVQFDHNGDTIVDGTALTKADGSFYYRAEGLEPSVASQTITAAVIEEDFQGNSFRSVPIEREFILTRAPLIAKMEYLTFIFGPTGTIQGEVVSDLPNTDLTIEYQLFGAGGHSDAPDFQDVDWNTWEPGAVNTTTVSASYKFLIDTPELTGGPSTALVRAIGNGVAGPWQSFNFVVGELTQSAPDVFDLDLPHTLPNTTNHVRDPLITGTLNDSNALEFVQGAYGVVEVAIYEENNPAAPPVVYRTSADGNGDFALTPSHLDLGLVYRAEVRSVIYNRVTGEELFGTPQSRTFELISKTHATATIDTYPTVGNPDPTTISGTVVNPDGRLGGLRVEIAYGADEPGNRVDHVVYTTVNDSNQAVFSFEPFGLPQGDHQVRLRVIEEVDWDLSGDDAGMPAWSGPVSFHLAEDQLDTPTLDQDVQDQIDVTNVAELGFRDAVFALLGELGIAGTGANSNSIDLGIGTMELMHKGGAGDASAERELTEAVFLPSAALSESEIAPVSASIVDLTTSDGDEVDVTYTLEQKVELDPDADEFMATTLFSVTIDSYDDSTDNLSFAGGAGDYSKYTFEFIADGSVGASDQLITATYSLRESIEFDFYYTETTDEGATTTTVGDYYFERLEGEDHNGLSYISTFTPTATTQKFIMTENVRLESWFDDSDTFSFSSDNSTRTNTITTEEHAVYLATLEVTDGQISTVNGGLPDTTASITTDLFVSADGVYGNTNHYDTSFADGGSENGSDTQIVQSYYEGTYYSETINYRDGHESEQTFDITELSNTTVNSSGSGTAISSSHGNSSNESWSYGGTTIFSSGSGSSGNYTEDASGTDLRTTLDASVGASESVTQDIGGSSSIIYTRSGGDDTGNGGSTFSSSSSAYTSRSATIDAVDDVYSLVGGQSSGYGGTVTLTANSSGRTVEDDGETNTETFYSSRQAARATGSGSSSSDLSGGEVQADTTSSSGGSSVWVTGVSAFQAVSTSSEGEAISRYNQAGTFSSGNSLNAQVIETNSNSTSPHRNIQGSAAEHESAEGFSTSYFRDSENFSLNTTTGKSAEASGIDFHEVGDYSSQRGWFTSSEEATSETISESNFEEDDTRGSAISITGGEINDSLRGTFKDTNGSSETKATAKQSQRGFSSATTKASTDVDTLERTEYVTSTSNQKGSQSLSSEGTFELLDGEIISQETTAASQSSGISSNAYSGFVIETKPSEYGDLTDDYFSSFRGNSQAVSSQSSTTVGAGSDQMATETGFNSLQSGKASSTGSSMAMVNQEHGSTSSFSNSRNSARQFESSHGIINAYANGNSSSEVFSQSSESAETFAFGRGSSTHIEDDVSISTISFSSNQGRVRNSTSGIIETDTQNRTKVDAKFNNFSTGRTSGSSTVTVHDNSGAKTRSTGGAKNYFTISTSGEIKRDHNEHSEEGTYSISSSNQQRSHVSIEGARSASGSRSSQTYESRSNSSLKGRGTYETPDEDDRTVSVSAASLSNSPANSTNGSSGSDNGGDDDSLESRANDFSGFDNSTTTTVNDGNRTTKTTRASESSSSTTANNGHITDSVGSKAKVSIEVKDNDYVNEKKVTDTSVYETSHDQTFTSAGSKPGDKQTLQINSSSTHTEGRKTEYKTPQALLVHDVPGMPFLDRYAPYDAKTNSVTDSSTTVYNASHSLGADGVSTVGGVLAATHFASATSVESYEGTRTERSVGDSDWTEELLAKSRETGNSNFVFELGTYGSGSAYRGFAVATARSWSDEVEEHTQTEVAPWGSEAEYVGTYTFTGSNKSSNSHQTTSAFKSNSTKVSTSRSSSTNNSDLNESTTDFTGENVPPSSRGNSKHTVISESTPEGWFKKDQLRQWPADPGYELFVYEDSSGPGTGNISATGGPANPGSIEVSAGVSGYDPNANPFADASSFSEQLRGAVSRAEAELAEDPAELAKAVAARQEAENPIQYDSVWGAFFRGLGIGTADVATSELPIVSQGRAFEEIRSGVDQIHGDELGFWERGFRIVDLFPGGSGYRKTGEALIGVADGANKLRKKVKTSFSQPVTLKTDPRGVDAPKGGALVPKGAKPLGDWGETRLKNLLDGKGSKTNFGTSTGRREVDRLVDRVAHESKAGVNVKPTSSIRRQIAKDKELIDSGQIEGAHWHFWQGADQRLLDELTEAGIDFTVH